LELIKPEEIEPTWWKETIVYQIYPRSFQDSNGDGIGDLRGIIKHLDYIADLGVETLWLNPIFSSPNDDNGYDVSDYHDIMSDFGNMADFDELLSEMKKRNLRMVLDLVPNHSSDEHRWFQEARKSKDNPYRDYYYWKPPKADGGPPNNWTSFFAPSAWELDEQTGEYYLHLFSVKQPDLNWENPKVRQEIYDIMHFWMQKGIDGFRIDVLTFISKDLTFPDQTPENFDGNPGNFFGNGPRIHEFLKEMNREVISQYDMMTVGESPGSTSDQALLYVGKDRKELHTIYHFDHMYLDRDMDAFFKVKKYDLIEFKRIVTDWDRLAEMGGWNTAFLGNHDFPRIVSRFGNSVDYRKESAKLLSMFLLTQRGTPYLYFGDEIGMTNVPWESLDKFRDLQVFDALEKHKAAGGDADEYIKWLKHSSRDNSRTPMQWNTSQNAGFSTGEPWIEVNPNYREINVEESIADPNSVLHFYKEMIRIRKANKALIYGHFKDLLPGHKSLFVYLRTMGDQRFLVMLNFSDGDVSLEKNEIPAINEFILYNYRDQPIHNDHMIILRPWEACLIK
jgi:oligo-1,6-glucosidase